MSKLALSNNIFQKYPFDQVTLLLLVHIQWFVIIIFRATIIWTWTNTLLGFPGGLDGKESTYNVGDLG